MSLFRRKHRRNRGPADVVADPLPEVRVQFSPHRDYVVYRLCPGPAYGIHTRTGQLVVGMPRGWTPVPVPPDVETGPEDHPHWPAYARQQTRNDQRSDRNDGSTDDREENR